MQEVPSGMTTGSLGSLYQRAGTIMPLKVSALFFFWEFACYVSFGVWVGPAGASRWGEGAGEQTESPTVEVVDEDTSKAYRLPVELNDETFTLVEWATGLTRRRSRFRYPFPPGIILVAVIAAAILVLVLNKRYQFLPQGKETSEGLGMRGSRRQGAFEGSIDLEVTYAALEGNTNPEPHAASERTRVVLFDLQKIILDLERVKDEIGGRRFFGMNEEKSSDASEANTQDLADLSDRLAATADAILSAVSAMQKPLSDSQSVSQLDAAVERMESRVHSLADGKALQELKRSAAELSEDDPAIAGATEEQKSLQQSDDRTSSKLVDWARSLSHQYDVLQASADAVKRAAVELRRQIDQI